jgi:thioredoxin-like negative regulator of GroEL
MLQRAGRLNEAQRALSHAWELEPSNADFVYALIDHYLKQGQVERVRDLVQEVITRYPDTPIGRNLRRNMTGGQQGAIDDTIP